MNARLNALSGKLILLLGSAALAGCSMAPKYVRPEAPVSPSFPEGSRGTPFPALSPMPLQLCTAGLWHP